MTRFSLATLFALPLVVASIYAAIVYTAALTVFYVAAAAALLAYALTFRQTGMQLDVRSRPGFRYVAACLVACSLTLVSVQTLRALSPAFRFWSWNYQMTSRGYKKIWHEPTRTEDGFVLSRGYHWEK